MWFCWNLVTWWSEEVMGAESPWMGLVPRSKRPQGDLCPSCLWEHGEKTLWTRKLTLPRNWTCWYLVVGLPCFQSCEKLHISHPSMALRYSSPEGPGQTPSYSPELGEHPPSSVTQQNDRLCPMPSAAETCLRAASWSAGQGRARDTPEGKGHPCGHKSAILKEVIWKGCWEVTLWKDCSVYPVNTDAMFCWFNFLYWTAEKQHSLITEGLTVLFNL